jgi:hypothetical protein
VGIDQLYKVPTGTTPFVEFTGVTWNTTPSQITVVSVIGVIDGRGFTVTTTVKLLPFVHPFVSVELMVKVADWGMEEVLEKVPVIAELGPVKFVHVKNGELEDEPTKVYVVPAGTNPFDAPGIRFIEPSLQITCVIPVITTFGLTVTTKLNGLPVQFPPIVYAVEGVIE